MKARTRRRLSLAVGISALLIAAVGAETWLRWGLDLGPVGTLYGYGGMLRFEAGPDHPSSFAFRPHPFRVQGFRGVSMRVVEVGSVPLFGLALALGTAAALIRRTPRSRAGLCPSCRYDIRGLPAAAAQCPECGRALQPVPQGPASGGSHDAAPV
jgi:hypothetical protein